LSKKGELPKKFEEIHNRIEKVVTPHITVKIAMPEGIDKEEFLKLEDNDKFLHALSLFVKRWLKRNVEAKKRQT